MCGRFSVSNAKLRHSAEVGQPVLKTPVAKLLLSDLENRLEKTKGTVILKSYSTSEIAGTTQ